MDTGGRRDACAGQERQQSATEDDQTACRSFSLANSKLGTVGTSVYPGGLRFPHLLSTCAKKDPSCFSSSQVLGFPDVSRKMFLDS